MALVKMTDVLIDKIADAAKKLYDEDLKALPPVPKEFGEEVSNRLYDLALPDFLENEIKERMPKWMIRTCNTRIIHYKSHEITAKLGRGRYDWGDNGSTLYNAPGFESVRVKGDRFYLEVKDFGKMDIEIATALQSIDAIQQRRKDVEQQAATAHTNMKKFLGQHKSLQSALPAFGQALWTFVPDDVKAQYQRVVERGPRKPRQPGEKIIVNEEVIEVDSIIAKVTAKHLGLED